MKKLLPILLLFGTSSVYAGAMTTRHQTSLQQVQSPTITTTQRTGNSYSVSGNNVNTSYTYCSAGCDGNSPTNTTSTSSKPAQPLNPTKSPKSNKTNQTKTFVRLP